MKRKLVSKKMSLLFVIAFIFGFSAQSNAQWKAVRVGGGGNITSIQAHPKVQNLNFITTDVGTPYRWNSVTEAWEGLFYNLPASYWGKNAAGNIAFDPSDVTGNVLYSTIGGVFLTGGLLKSTDRGNSWTDCQLPLDVKPNSDQSYGQRLAVDPANSNIVYVTTRPKTSTDTVTTINGTFKSVNAGATWVKINNLSGAFLYFDVSGGTTSGITNNILIGCADGVYQSTNGGANFTLMSGSPTNSSRAAIHSNGTLYVTHFKSVTKWNGTAWSDITPPVTTFVYSALEVNPNNSDQVIVGLGSFSPYRYDQFVSNNGGSSWTAITPTPDLSEVPWFTGTIGAGLRDFCWDPFNQNMVWFTDFYNTFQTTNIWAGTNVTWKARGVGEEETVAIGNLLCPPSGGNVLLTNVADIGGFDIKSLTSSPSMGMVTFFPYSTSGDGGNMTGVAIEETNPNFIARVGRHGWSGSGYGGYSADGGNSYTLWICPTDAAGGRIAVSATSETMVWATQSGPCYRSIDRGTTWVVISSLPSGIINGGANVFNSGPVFPIAADKVNGNKFYVYNAGKMYVSTDGGSTFVAKATLPYPFNLNPLAVETTPGKEGDIWIAMNSGGLFHSIDSGTTFTQIANISVANSVTLGKASPGTPAVPALYVYGTVNNVSDGLFRSNDNGLTWVTISAPLHTGCSTYGMSADRQVYGRVFFGTTGNGTLYVEDYIDTQAPTAPTALLSSVITATTFQLLWTASMDNVSASGYDIYVNGVLKGSSTTTLFNVTGLSAATTYAITVKAKDPAGNISALSSVLNVTTLAVDVPLVNIALNKTVTASSSPTLAVNSTDGNFTTPWTASTGSKNEWIKVDLGGVYNITGAEITWNHPTWSYQYKIDVSNDNSTWVTASDQTANTIPFLTATTSFISNGYRYIRLTVTNWGNGGYWTSIEEFRVFGTSVTTLTKEVQNSEVKIYPNPTSEYLIVENVKLNAEITISTSNGMIVYNKRTIKGGNLTLSTSNWAKGVYLVRVKDDNGLSIKKVIVQ